MSAQAYTLRGPAATRAARGAGNPHDRDHRGRGKIRDVVEFV